MPEGANTFRQQPIVRLKKRRDEGPYKSVPMILNPPSQWDQGVQSAIITYKGGPKRSATAWLWTVRGST
jgi:hypothetical protein